MNSSERSFSLSVPLLTQAPEAQPKRRFGCLSRLFFFEAIAYIKMAGQTTLENEMIDELTYEERSRTIYHRFATIFNNQLRSENQLAISLLKLFRVPILMTFILSICSTSMQMVMPILINKIITYISNPDRETQEGIILVSAIVLSRLLNALTSQHSSFIMRKTGYSCIAALSMSLMEKSMKVSFLSNKKYSAAEVINLLQVDCEKIEIATYSITDIVLCPIQLALGVFMMYYYIGISFLAGVGVILISVVVNFIIGNKQFTYYEQQMAAKDERTRATTEMLSQIKFIKINAFEQYFIERVQRCRDKELRILRSWFLLICVTILCIYITPMLIINGTFAVYVWLQNQMNAATTFTIISLFEVLQGPLVTLPFSVSSLIQANVSLNRLQSYLLTDEMMTDCIQEGPNTTEKAIVMRNVNLKWGNDATKPSTTTTEGSAPPKSKVQIQEINESLTESFVTNLEVAPILKNINISIERGSFVAIVGDVGSGKSSIIQALLGEMIHDTQDVSISMELNGSTAYLSQKPWIQNASVRDNILFGLEFEEQRYKLSLSKSCLEQDIHILVNGDSTMIGENGVNLSGGQKARIALARAVYSQSDIYLLDDPISAVDVHVGKDIIHECLNGYLKHTTRILVTHALNYCQYADYVYLMENGMVKDQGTFKEIQQTQTFEAIYKKFFKDGGQAKEADEEREEREEQKLVIKKASSKPKYVVPEEQPKDFIDELMLAEDRERGNISGDTLRRYFKLQGFGLFMILPVFVAAQISIQIFSNIWLAYWTKEATKNPDIDNVYYLEVFSLFSLSFGAFAFARTVTTVLQGLSFSRKVHDAMLICLSYAPQCSFFERVPLGRIINRFTKDLSVIDTDMQWQTSSMMITTGRLIGAIFVTIYASSLLILIPFTLYFSLTLYLQRFYMKASRDLYRLESISKSPILSFFTETAAGLPTIRAFKKQVLFTDRHGSNMDTNRKIQLVMVQTNIFFGMFCTMLSLTVFITALTLCVFYRSENPAFAGLLISYADEIDSGVQSVISAMGVLESQMISFERCIAYSRVEPEPAYKALVDQKLNDHESTESIHVEGWPTNGLVEFRNVSVRYRDTLPPALKNTSFVINPREKIGVVGRTGAGKSTITLAILRILETLDGGIYIDGLNIAEISLQQLREQVTMIMQDATIFQGTLRDNIDPLKRHNEESIIKVIADCCLSQLSESRKGLESEIEESGTNLSAGEKQLICIARAVLKRSPIVLIDEATANIDIDTEHQIQETIKSQFKDCTVITIAHRITTILHCDKFTIPLIDRILVVDRGGIKEFKTTQELLDDKTSTFYGIYQETLKQQQQQ